MVARIGISTYSATAHWSHWARPAELLAQTYIRAIESAGACPLLLPTSNPDLAPAALRGIDALVLAGGPDLDRSPRDVWEQSLLSEALARDLPILGICRGMQLMNVHLGGSLIQDLPRTPGGPNHHGRPGGFGTHRVTLLPTSRLGGIIGGDLEVPSLHHQAIDRLGFGVRPVGWAADGTIEAVDVDGPAFAVGVQWHPEEDGGARLFAALADRAGVRT